MSIPDPPWKLKTRPCPFYSQGRCLFSDSCNFLHDVKIKVKSPAYEITSVFDTVEGIQNPPSIQVSGVATPPTRDSLGGPANSIRSPPRSPRLSSLLLALGDAIGAEEEGGWTESLETYEEPESIEVTEGAGPEAAYPGFSEGDALRVVRNPALSPSQPRTPDLDGLDERGDDATVTLSQAAYEEPESVEVSEVGSADIAYSAFSEGDILPVAEVVTETMQAEVRNPTFSPSHVQRSDVDGLDDGDALTMSRQPLMEDFVAAQGESGLLSPIEIKLAAPCTNPLGSLDSMCRREDSIDSGYADNWTGPAPLALSPPNSDRRFSTLSILSSPFGTPSARVLSPTFVPSTSSGWPATTLFSPRMSAAGDADEPRSPPDDSALLDDLDSPSEYHRRHSSSALGSPKSSLDAEDTVKPSTATALHDEGFDESLSFDEDTVPAGFVDAADDTRHPHQSFVDSGIVNSPLHSPPGPSAALIAEEDVFIVPHSAHSSPSVGLKRLSSMSGLGSFVEETPSRSSRRNSRAPALSEDASQGTPLVEVSSADSVDLEQDPDAPATTNEEAYLASYTVGSSPDVDPDTSGEVVSSNAPSPFVEPAPANETLESSDPSTSAASYNESGTDIYDEYYSSVPVSPANSFSFISHAFDDHPSHFAPTAVSSPPSRVSTPSSSRAPVFYQSGQTSPYSAGPSSSVPNLSTPFRINTSFSSPYQSPTSAPATSRPPSQLGSARFSLKSPLSASVLSPSPIEPRSGEPSSTKVPFGFRHSARARSQDPSLSSIRTFGSTSSTSTRHRPPALVGIDSIHGQSRSNSSGSSHARDSQLLSPEPHVHSASPRRLKPLRLSLILNTSSSVPSSSSASVFPPSLTTATTASSHTPSSPTVLSEYSISNNHLLSSPRSSSISGLNTQHAGQPHSAPPTDHEYPPIPITDTTTCRQSWQHRFSQDLEHKQAPSRQSSLTYAPSYTRPSSRLSEHLMSVHEDEEVDFTARYDDTIAADGMDDTIRGAPLTASPRVQSRPPSVLHSPIHAIATPRPTLLFAIASDDVNEVRRVLESGEAGPNDDVGPQSALAFAVTSNQLKHKQEIIKLLLAHGANPSALNTLQSTALSRSVSPSDSNPGGRAETPSAPGPLENLDPATRYFISRAEAPQTRRASALIHRSFFRPLAKVRYDLVGQDRALEQLFRVLSMPSAAPIVVLLCGPSGHGKSLLARRFGSLLDVPTHTVNMTTLTSTHDIWRSYSMSPFEEPLTSTLGDFLRENQGKRCVVVLDEIEKVEDQKYLSSLLMPWELGRCSFEAGQRHVDVSKVIWLGTSNIGHDLVFEHQTQRVDPEATMTREDYVDLMGLLRPQVSDRLGPSLLSRVTTVLPFVPFSAEEKMAISAEALHSLTGEEGPALPSATVEKLVKDSLHGYAPAEGARSLYRAVSNLLLDTLF